MIEMKDDKDNFIDDKIIGMMTDISQCKCIWWICALRKE
jgi:hypothetical protein